MTICLKILYVVSMIAPNSTPVVQPPIHNHMPIDCVAVQWVILIPNWTRGEVVTLHYETQPQTSEV